MRLQLAPVVLAQADTAAAVYVPRLMLNLLCPPHLCLRRHNNYHHHPHNYQQQIYHELAGLQELRFNWRDKIPPYRY